VTLHGPGGIGKSRLALEVARALEPSFRDGVYFVPLASATDPERLAATLAQALDSRSRAVKIPSSSS
jgi:predicted ATPase